MLCISDKCYYYKQTETKYLKDYLSNSEIIKNIINRDNLGTENFENVIQEILKNDDILSNLTRAQFATLLQCSIKVKELGSNFDTKELKINGIDFNKITFKIHQWIGVECSDASDDYVELSFFSGISNTLSKKAFGNYLLNGRSLNPKVFSICYEDMWGNLSCQKFDKNGIGNEFKDVSFSFQSSAEESKITFSFKNLPQEE